MAEVEALFPSADRHPFELRAMAELERLPGVISASVWLDSHGNLRDARLHIMPGAAPTIIGNAASRVLQALDIPFDPRALRTVTVALPDEIQAAALASPSAGRYLLLQDLTLNRVGTHVTCRVQLRREESVAAGEARELDTITGRCRAAALATLRAAEDTADGLALGLEAVALAPLFGRTYATVSVEASVGRRVATLCGIVPLDPSRAPEEAVCMATLRAIDRWIAL
ncbi:MAG: hypothetical protein WEF86_11860 [Gemmatimonadota bacterium]